MADAPARGPRRGPAHHDPVEKPPINAAERLPMGRPRPYRFAVVAISRQAGNHDLGDTESLCTIRRWQSRSTIWPFPDCRSYRLLLLALNIPLASAPGAARR
jgi:hypothetical protein